MDLRREAKKGEMEVATRGHKGLPLPTLRIPEMQIRLNYRRIVNPFCGDLQYCEGGEGMKRRDGITRDVGEGERKRDSTWNRLQVQCIPHPLHTYTLHPSMYSAARISTTRMDAPCGCTVALARRRDSPGSRCGCMMYNRHRGLCSGEYANQYTRPGSDLPLWLVPSPATHGSHRRNETVNTEGSRKSCTCIYIRTFRLSLCRIHFRIASRLVNPFNIQAWGKKPLSRVTEGTVRGAHLKGRRIRDPGCVKTDQEVIPEEIINKPSEAMFSIPPFPDTLIIALFFIRVQLLC